MVYLTIIPRVWLIANEAGSVDLAIIISYPISGNGKIVSLKKRPQNIEK